MSQESQFTISIESDHNSSDFDAIFKDFSKEHQERFDSFRISWLEKIENLEKEIRCLKATRSLGNTECENESRVEPASNFLRELSTKINIPGLQYVAGRRHWIHRFFWIVFHVLALLVSYYYIQNAYNTWQSSPTVQSLTNTLTNVSSVPFPAVSYCVRFSLAINYSEKINLRRKCMFGSRNKSEISSSCNEEENAIFLISSLFVPAQSDNSYLFSNTTNIDENTFLDTIDTILKTESFTYNSYVDDYVDFLSRTNNTSPPYLLNDEFVCKTFNSLPYKSHFKDGLVYYLNKESVNAEEPSRCKWNPENVLSPTCKELKNELLYTNESLLIKFRLKITNTTEFRSDKQLLLSIHNPSTVPTLGNLEYLTFSSSKDINVFVLPKVIVPEKNFHSLKPSPKGCLFSHERKLSMFKFYTQQNCLLECRLNCTLLKCGCITFNQPRFNTTDICGKPKYHNCLTGIWCGHCDCLPDCVSLDYSVQIKEHGLRKNVNDIHSDIYFRLKVAYKYNEFSTTLRHSISSMQEFLAYSAGILGLFNGFSLMAVCEVLYLMGLTFWAAVRRRIS